MATRLAHQHSAAFDTEVVPADRSTRITISTRASTSSVASGLPCQHAKAGQQPSAQASIVSHNGSKVSGIIKFLKNTSARLSRTFRKRSRVAALPTGQAAAETHPQRCGCQNSNASDNCHSLPINVREMPRAWNGSRPRTGQPTPSTPVVAKQQQQQERRGTPGTDRITVDAEGNWRRSCSTPVQSGSSQVAAEAAKHVIMIDGQVIDSEAPTRMSSIATRGGGVMSDRNSQYVNLDKSRAMTPKGVSGGVTNSPRGFLLAADGNAVFCASFENGSPVAHPQARRAAPSASNAVEKEKEALVEVEDEYPEGFFGVEPLPNDAVVRRDIPLPPPRAGRRYMCSPDCYCYLCFDRPVRTLATSRRASTGNGTRAC